MQINPCNTTMRKTVPMCKKLVKTIQLTFKADTYLIFSTYLCSLKTLSMEIVFRRAENR